MNLDILHRHTDAVLYTATLPDDPTLNHAQRLGLAVQQAAAAGVSLAHADLRDADCTNAYLVGIDFAGANCVGVDFAGANCAGIDFTEADVRYANCASVDFTDSTCIDTNFAGTDLRYANFAGCCCWGATFTKASTIGVQGLDIPIVPQLDAAILAAIQAPGCALDMRRWHSCATTHCRAGWAVHLAGEAGAQLEQCHGPETAAALIYSASVGYVPDFYASDEEALRDITERAAQCLTIGDPHDHH